MAGGGRGSAGGGVDASGLDLSVWRICHFDLARNLWVDAFRRFHSGRCRGAPKADVSGRHKTVQYDEWDEEPAEQEGQGGAAG